jgi:hypothetical protein
MYCPNCGVKLLTLNQRFCHNCGNDNTELLEKIEKKPTSYQYSPPIVQQSSQGYEKPYGNWQETQQRPNVLLKEKLGPYSKKALAFSIVSMILIIIDLILGFGLRSYISYFFYEYGYFSQQIIGTLITIVIINGLGLGFGIFASVNSKKARYYEPHNSAEVTGRVFGIIAIIINAIAFALASFSPWMIYMLYMPVYLM